MAATENKFKCLSFSCEKSFKTAKGLKYHQTTYHEGIRPKVRHQIFHCCDKTFKSKKAFKYHRSTCHDGVRYVCECGKLLASKVSLNIHIKTVHEKVRPTSKMNNKTFQCPSPSCGKIYMSSKALKQHQKAIHEGVRYKCNKYKCCKLYVSKRDLNVHIKTVHENVRPTRKINNKTFQCPSPSCGKTYLSSSALKLHQTAIHEGVRYKCNKCCKLYISKRDLNVHIKTVHENIRPSSKTFQCPIPSCEKTFKTTRGLKQHQNSVHKGVRYACKCGKLYVSKKYLNIHIKIVHEKIRPTPKTKTFQCALCDETFRTWSELHFHKLTVHEARRFKCKLCKKLFATKSHLFCHHKIHERTATLYHLALKAAYKTKLQNGSVYQNSFETQSELSDMTDTNVEVIYYYKCKYCPRSYVNLMTLQGHVNAVHLNKKPFPCTKCPLKFSAEQNLRRHVTIAHSEPIGFEGKSCDLDLELSTPVQNINDDKAFKSNLWSETFSDSSNLQVHEAIHRPLLNKESTSEINIAQLAEMEVIRAKLTCEKCDFKFRNLDRLRDHCLRIHWDDHFCKVCKRPFYDLSRHISKCNQGEINKLGED